MVRTLSYGSGLRLDTGRILAYAAVVAVHALAFLLLLVPMAARPPAGATLDEPSTDRWNQRIEVKPPPVPPEIVQPAQPRTTPQPPQQRAMTRTPAPSVNPVVVDSGQLPADPAPATEAGPAIDIAPPTGGPIQVGQLAYVKATPPPYPRSELTRGIGGEVLLRVLVDTDGAPIEVVVEHSSGNASLDRAALRHVLKTWRFQPALQNGQPVQAYGLVPIRFSLQ